MNQPHADHRDHGAAEEPAASARGLSEVGDDRLGGPSVTPVPAPPDDQLVRLAGAGAVAAVLMAAVVAWWLRRNIAITRR